MSATTIQNLENEVRVFKGLYKSQINLTTYWAKQSNELLNRYIRTILYHIGECETFYDIVEKENYEGFKYNYYTEIKDYTNKKGHTSKAHYMGTKYIGSVRKLGEKPIIKTFYGTKDKAEKYINNNENYKNKNLIGWNIITEEDRVVFTPKWKVPSMMSVLLAKEKKNVSK